MSAPVSRSSTRDFSPPEIARTAVVRLSMPHVALTGAHAPGTVRLYELVVGQDIAVRSGRFVTRPAMYFSISGDISANRFFCEPAPRRLWCKWPLEPGRSAFHLAMNVGIRLWRAAISLTAVLKSAALSAASNALSKAIAASYTPGPVSV